MTGCTTTVLGYGGKAASAVCIPNPHSGPNLPFTGLSLGTFALCGALLIVVGLCIYFAVTKPEEPRS